MKMTASSTNLMKRFAAFTVLASCAAVLSSCKTKSADAGSEYPQYGADGTYNPYPAYGGSTGGASGGGAQQYQTYQPSQSTAQQSYPTYTPAPQPSYTPEPSYTPTPSYTAPKPKKKTSTASSGGGKSKGSYTVRSGDTLYRIALNNGTTVAKLRSANGISGDVIQPGQRLRIP